MTATTACTCNSAPERTPAATCPLCTPLPLSDTQSSADFDSEEEFWNRCTPEDSDSSLDSQNEYTLDSDSDFWNSNTPDSPDPTTSDICRRLDLLECCGDHREDEHCPDCSANSEDLEPQGQPESTSGNSQPKDDNEEN